MSELQFQSRDEAKRKRELEEARKAGTAPAEKDEEGRDINPHIPQYISKAPWYLNQTAPGLKHQRHKEEPKRGIDVWYERGVNKNTKKYIYKGGCVNCGALTHTVKDCVERPRKIGAKYTQKDIAFDEYIPPDLQLEYDAKRDRWAGYTPDDYQLVINEYETADLIRNEKKKFLLDKQFTKKKKEKKSNNKQKDEKQINDASNNEQNNESDYISDSDSENDSVDSDDAKMREFDKTSAPMGSKDDTTRTTTRNLRIREDTAKYLYNLDINSAFYDPKSRSMRANPLIHLNDDQQVYKGDNVERNSGDAFKSQQMELFAWEVYKRNGHVHFNALPTQLEQMYKEHKEKKENFSNEKRRKLLDKYGGEENLNTRKDVLFVETEQFLEYTVDGQLKPMRKRYFVKSKYVEDIYNENHTSVWGSYFDINNKKWGYSCCLQTERDVECTSINNQKQILNQAAIEAPVEAI